MVSEKNKQTPARLHTVIMADVRSDNDRHNSEEVPKWCQILNLGEQPGNRNASVQQFHHGDSHRDHNKYYR